MLPYNLQPYAYTCRSLVKKQDHYTVISGHSFVIPLNNCVILIVIIFVHLNILHFNNYNTYAVTDMFLR